MKTKDIGVLLICLSIIFGWLETIYFVHPNQAQRICAGIVIFMLITGLLLLIPKNKLTK